MTRQKKVLYAVKMRLMIQLTTRQKSDYFKHLSDSEYQKTKYLWRLEDKIDSCCCVLEKPRHCKAIIFQLKINVKR